MINIGGRSIQPNRAFWVGLALVIIATFASINLGPIRSQIYLLLGNNIFEKVVSDYGRLGHTAFWEKLTDADLALDSAKIDYHLALQYNPHNSRASLMLARTYALQGDLEMSRKNYQTYIDARPNDPLGPLELGFVLERICNPASLSEPITTASRLSTTCENQDLKNRIRMAWNTSGVSLPDFMARGQEVRAAGQSDNAIVWYQRAALLEPSAGTPWFEIAMVLDSEGETEGALKALNHSVTVEPTLRDSWYALGQAHEAASDWQAAIEAYERGLEAIYGKIGRSNFEFRRGRILLMVLDPPDLEGALAAFTNAIRLNEYATELWQRSEAFHRRGNTSAQLGNWSAAIADYEAALLHNPNHYWVHLSMARAQWENGALEDAIGWAEAATVISPTLKNAYSLLGEYYRQTDQIERAVESYLRVLVIDPEDARAKTELEQLRFPAVEVP